MSDSYLAGLDLGQSRDFSALAVVERAESEDGWDAAMYAYKKKAVLRLRHLERIPLGTPYPRVVERVARATEKLAALGTRRLAVDATGVGRPVVDMLEEARLGCELWPVVITGGDTESREGGFYRTPKRDLVVGLQLLLQRGHLQIASGLEMGEALVKELTGMEARGTAGGREQFGAWREGEHDDLVLAVALACWMGRKVYGEKVAGPVGWWVRRGVA